MGAGVGNRMVDLHTVQMLYYVRQKKTLGQYASIIVTSISVTAKGHVHVVLALSYYHLLDLTCSPTTRRPLRCINNRLLPRAFPWDP